MNRKYDPLGQSLPCVRWAIIARVPCVPRIPCEGPYAETRDLCLQTDVPVSDSGGQMLKYDWIRSYSAAKR